MENFTTALIIITIIAISTIFNIYLTKKFRARAAKKFPEELEKGIIYRRDTSRVFKPAEITIQPRFFKPKIGSFMVIVNFVFIVGGLCLLIFTTKEGLLEYLFPLVFIGIAALVLADIFTTKYQLDNDGIKVSDITSRYSIKYEDITEVKARTINLIFKHGKMGRIRSETCADTLFITSSKPISRNKFTIIISPKDKEGFIKLLSLKLGETTV